MSYTDAQLIASIRENAFQGAVKLPALQHHKLLQMQLRPHFEAIMNLIDELAVPDVSGVS